MQVLYSFSLDNSLVVECLLGMGEVVGGGVAPKMCKSSTSIPVIAPVWPFSIKRPIPDTDSHTVIASDFIKNEQQRVINICCKNLASLSTVYKVVQRFRDINQFH